MAKGRKTGGRKKGTPNKVPGEVKASVRRALEEIGTEEPDLIKNGLKKGLQDGNVAVLRLAADYLDGKPVEIHEHSGEVVLRWKGLGVGA